MSLAIFALVSVAGYQLLNSLTVAAEMTSSQARQRWQLESTLLLIEQDMRFLLARSVRVGSEGQWLPPLTSRHGSLLEFSRAGLPVDGAASVYAPARVVYRLERNGGEEMLVREVYPSLEKTREKPPLKQQLLSGLERLSVRFRSGDGVWHSHWPPAPAAAGAQQQSRLPVAVEFVLAFPERAPLRRLISRR